MWTKTMRHVLGDGRRAFGRCMVRLQGAGLAPGGRGTVRDALAKNESIAGSSSKRREEWMKMGGGSSCWRAVRGPAGSGTVGHTQALAT